MRLMVTYPVRTREDLLRALETSGIATLKIMGAIGELPSLRLPADVGLIGEGDAMLSFATGEGGVCVSAGNKLQDLHIVTDPDRRAVFNDSDRPAFGQLTLERLLVTGSVRLLATGQALGSHLEAHGVYVETADARGFEERPAGFGVEVLPGAFTLWNLQPDPASRVTADLTGISVGRAGAPVQGGGIFVGGTTNGGRTLVRRLETGEVHSNGGIAPGTPDRISGGVFVVSGAWVDEVRNGGAVTTYGANDMVLDNWGAVERWIAEAPITSYGPSAIGFVNFGDLGDLRIEAPVQTFGTGARGFNIYASTLRSAEFDRIVTHGDGAVGVQIGQPVGRMMVKRGIETFGARGPSLVKGVVTNLPATALSVKHAGSAREIVVEGGLTSRGRGVDAFELQGGIERFQVSGGFGPTSADSDPI